VNVLTCNKHSHNGMLKPTPQQAQRSFCKAATSAPTHLEVKLRPPTMALPPRGNCCSFFSCGTTAAGARVRLQGGVQGQGWVSQQNRELCFVPRQTGQAPLDSFQ
jgi:hypothetical protein